MKSILLIAFCLSLAGCPKDTTPAPTPTPTATPLPTATAVPTATPLSCLPKPPPLEFIALKIHNHPEPEKFVIDSTPIVKGIEYCTAVGFVNRQTCPYRQEGDPVRVICEREALGGDGPEWSSPTGNDVNPSGSNPWLGVFHGASGIMRACTRGAAPKCFDISIP